SDSGGSESGGRDSGGSDGGGASDGGHSPQDASEYRPDSDLRSETLPVSAEDAGSRAEATAGRGRRPAVERDDDEAAGGWRWGIKILVARTDHKVVIDAAAGEGVADEQERTDDQEQTVDLDDPMSYDEASEIAIEKLDGPMRSWKLEYDEGMVQYQFDIGAGDDPQEVTIDAESGRATVD